MKNFILLLALVINTAILAQSQEKITILEKARSALERVHRTKDIIEQGQVAWGLLKLQQVGLNGLKVFFGFCNEVCE